MPSALNFAKSGILPEAIPTPCSDCRHKEAIDFVSERNDPFQACFAAQHHQRDMFDPQFDLDYLQADGFEASLGLGSLDTSVPFGSDDLFSPQDSTHASSVYSFNGLNELSTPATDFSPTSDSMKHFSVDLDGMPARRTSSMSSSAGQICSPEAITPGKTVVPLQPYPTPAYPMLCNRPSLTITLPPQSHQRCEVLPQPTRQSTAPKRKTARATKAAKQSASKTKPANPPACCQDAGSPPPAGPKRKRTRKQPADGASPNGEKQARFLERNRNAASRCRARRKVTNDHLEVRVKELEMANRSRRIEMDDLLATRQGMLDEMRALGINPDDPKIRAVAAAVTKGMDECRGPSVKTEPSEFEALEQMLGSEGPGVELAC